MGTDPHLWHATGIFTLGLGIPTHQVPMASNTNGNPDVSVHRYGCFQVYPQSGIVSSSTSLRILRHFGKNMDHVTEVSEQEMVVREKDDGMNCVAWLQQPLSPSSLRHTPSLSANAGQNSHSRDQQKLITFMPTTLQQREQPAGTNNTDTAEVSHRLSCGSCTQQQQENKVAERADLGRSNANPKRCRMPPQKGL